MGQSEIVFCDRGDGVDHMLGMLTWEAGEKNGLVKREKSGLDRWITDKRIDISPPGMARRGELRALDGDA